MYCNNCGAEINDQAVVCPKCGVPTAKLSNFGAKESAPHSVSAIVCSILGLIIPVLGLLMSIIAICLSASGKKRVRKNPERYESSTSLTVAMIFGIIGLVGWIVYIAYVCLIGYGLFEMFEYLEVFEDLFY